MDNRVIQDTRYDLDKSVSKDSSLLDLDIYSKEYIKAVNKLTKCDFKLHMESLVRQLNQKDLLLVLKALERIPELDDETPIFKKEIVSNLNVPGAVVKIMTENPHHKSIQHECLKAINKLVFRWMKNDPLYNQCLETIGPIVGAMDCFSYCGQFVLTSLYVLHKMGELHSLSERKPYLDANVTAILFKIMNMYKENKDLPREYNYLVVRFTMAILWRHPTLCTKELAVSVRDLGGFKFLGSCIDDYCKKKMVLRHDPTPCGGEIGNAVMILAEKLDNGKTTN